MKYLREINVTDKRVLLRVDFNVPVGKDGKVDRREDWRIRAVLPTIEYLIRKKAKIILLAHLGQPEGKVVEELRLDPVARRLDELLKKKVTKLDDCLGPDVQKAVSELKSGEIILLENVRFYLGEEGNDPEFARQIAALGEVYVNDAFSVSHRGHATLVQLPLLLPHVAGLLLEKELKSLNRLFEKPKHPLLVIIGGAKISTKIKVIKNFLKNADDLILGGALANTVICAKGICIGKSIVEEEMFDEAKGLELTDTKLHLPVDAVVSVDKTGQAPVRIAPIGNTSEEEMILDIGPDTIELFKQIIAKAKTIIWNGPMGLLEVEPFARGSREIAKAISKSKAFSVVGGGETIMLLEELELIGKISHVCGGGGAMLDFLSGKELPGIESLG